MLYFTTNQLYIQQKSTYYPKTWGNIFVNQRDKPRQFLKNWRPITLLNVFYKLISGCLSRRLKPILDLIISDTQSGFMKGRYIGENTRFVYDIMAYTESEHIPGLLVLIDFEKAFDSISWSLYIRF